MGIKPQQTTSNFIYSLHINCTIGTVNNKKYNEQMEKAQTNNQSGA